MSSLDSKIIDNINTKKFKKLQNNLLFFDKNLKAHNQVVFIVYAMCNTEVWHIIKCTLDKSYTSENYKFLDECVKLNQNQSANKRRKILFKICDNYIRNEAINEINISGNLRSRVIVCVDNLSLTNGKALEWICKLAEDVIRECIIEVIRLIFTNIPETIINIRISEII